MNKIKTGPAQLRHIAKIDAFIPEAMKFAKLLTGNGLDCDAASFTRVFYSEMNRLTITAGLRVA